MGLPGQIWSPTAFLLLAEAKGTPTKHTQIPWPHLAGVTCQAVVAINSLVVGTQAQTKQEHICHEQPGC